jgi:hypothetical protein
MSTLLLTGFINKFPAFKNLELIGILWMLQWSTKTSILKVRNTIIRVIGLLDDIPGR